MTNHLFYEPQPGYVCHSAASKLLVVAPGLSDLVGYATGDVFPAAAKLVEATQKYASSEEMNHAAFNVAFNTDLPIMRWFGQDPVRGPRFARTMQALTAREGYDIKHAVAGFDWARLGRGLVVDVGGSYGHASIAIAEVAPELKLVVQDLPQIISQAKTDLPEKMKERVSFMAHDFFTPQPIEADVYFLRFILHDYPDKYAALILQNLVPVLKNGSRLIIVDSVLPPPGVAPSSEERLMRSMVGLSKARISLAGGKSQDQVACSRDILVWPSSDTTFWVS